MSLATHYKTIAPELSKDLGIANAMAVPRLEKIMVNCGFGSKRQVSKFQELVMGDLARITGQKPTARSARKAIAGFKLRQGEVIGASVTLRGQRMFDFLERLIGVVLPRIRDFRGLPATGFDGKGNYSFGVREQTVFPEIDQERVSEFYGIGITIVTTAQNDKAGEALLRKLGLPLKTDQSSEK